MDSLDFRFIENSTLWGILIGIPLFLYVGAPCLIKFTQRYRKDLTLVAFDPNETSPPLEVGKFFFSTGHRLEQLGFREVGHFVNSDMIANVRTILALFEHEEQQDAAIAAVAFAYSSGGKVNSVVQESAVEFDTEFQDGVDVDTKNSMNESAFAYLPHKKTTDFPGLQDLEVLYRAHQYICGLHKKAPKKPLPLREQWGDKLLEGMVNELEAQLDTGYLTLTTNGDGEEFYVPTWKGAYIMTWINLWPIKQIRLSMRRRKARALLNEYGLADAEYP